MARILVADDDAHIRQLVVLYMKKEGYEVRDVANGEEALVVMDKDHMDLAVIDIMMPEMDGWELCKEIRSRGDMPILMITAKGEAEDRVKGFQLGTDDYVVKPFDPTELVLRVKALLKRYRVATSQQVVFGDTIIDGERNEIRVKGEVIQLPLKEFELLFKLGGYPGQIFTRAQLIEQIWGLDYEGYDRTVDVHIKRLRQRLEGRTEDIWISTVRGLGYRLEAKGE
ncbi:response regulator transcription factor [Marininema halotolerans]|uniref:Heme response regulator HssR n=1 Tax=Marininema halotolerans TaxID=1155944 RepID=A0A1I6SHM6_9BACL|nr:response regulator transcription factor [Marininema halotolerans]SFS76248.1 DNA-binding response regulator, OmpR family, contains REC and winged-helix (wHTH) domain [Marininema halotolerans]